MAIITPARNRRGKATENPQENQEFPSALGHDDISVVVAAIALWITPSFFAAPVISAPAVRNSRNRPGRQRSSIMSAVSQKCSKKFQETVIIVRACPASRRTRPYRQYGCNLPFAADSDKHPLVIHNHQLMYPGRSPPCTPGNPPAVHPEPTRIESAHR